VIRSRLEHSAGFDDRSHGGLLEPLNFISQILDLGSLFLNHPQQRKDQWRLIGDRNFDAGNRDPAGRFGLLLAHSP